MSGPRISGRPVRQLSLQQPVASRRQQVRRHRSAEDPEYLARANLGAKSGKIAREQQVRVAWGEQRRDDDSVERVEVVARQIRCGRPELRTASVATAKTPGRATRGDPGIDRATILYSRQELAERLRLAWKHRQERRANIDIFLAHGTIEERCESVVNTSASHTPRTPGAQRQQTQQTQQTQQIQQTHHGEKERSLEFRRYLRSNDLDTNGNKSTRIDSSGETREEIFPLEESKDLEWAPNGGKNYEPDELENGREDNKGDRREEEVDTKENQKGAENSAADGCLDDKKKRSVNVCFGETTLPCIRSAETNTDEAKEKREGSTTAKQKRACFHSGANRAFLGPVNESMDRVAACAKPEASNVESKTDGRTDSPIGWTSANTRTTTIRKPIQNATIGNSVLDAKSRRTNSAPPERRWGSSSRVQVNIVINTPRVPGPDDKTLKKLETASEEKGQFKTERFSSKATSGRSVRSAPTKKRSRSAKRRSFGQFYRKDDEDGRTRSRSSNRGKTSAEARPLDVVTMVSLVSSADSDTDDENSPVDDRLIDQLRSKLPTTPIIKTRASSSLGVIRKHVKSVSFHEDSFDDVLPVRECQPRTKDDDKRVARSRSLANAEATGRDDTSSRKVATSTTNASPRRVEAASGLACPVLAATPGSEDAPDGPLTDREKRCLAVPIEDTRDKKRKLLRTRSTPNRVTILEGRTDIAEAREHRLRATVSRTTSNDLTVQQFSSSAENVIPRVDATCALPEAKTPNQEAIATVPRLQTTKEKECWHLYRKMCDKGVYVSFDTVLRGMLTPTEYRLRQKELLQEF